MAVYPPEPKFRDSDKKLLMLMGRLLLEQAGQDSLESNLPSNKIALSDSEAAELAEKLEYLSESREFLEAAYFVESVTSHNPKEEERAREIYLAGRKKRGRSRVLATAEWLDFKARLGIGQEGYPGRKKVNPMEFSHFENMEKKLLLSAGINKKVVDIVMANLSSRREKIEQLKQGKQQIQHGVIRSIIVNSVSKLKNRFEEREISKDRMSAAIIIVSDVSVLFTTRDWSVTGTLSTLAGAANQVIY